MQCLPRPFRPGITTVDTFAPSPMLASTSMATVTGMKLFRGLPLLIMVACGAGTTLPEADASILPGSPRADASTALDSGVVVNPPSDAGVDDTADAGTPSGSKDAGSGGVTPDAGTSLSDAGDGRFEIGPKYTADPNGKATPGIPKGKVYSFEIDANGSKVFPGNFQRKVWVYVPMQYVDGTAAPFMVVQDGSYQVDRIRNTLDNLIAQKKVPTLVMVLINPGDANGARRNLEYDRVSEDYSRFIETEVLPVIPKRPDIQKDYPKLRFTSDPEGRGAIGCSSGAAAAFTMAWLRPDLYRRVLTSSGTFVKQYATKDYPLGAWEYHAKVIAQSPLKPLRVVLDVGENDLNLNGQYNDTYHDWVLANEAMYKVLAAKGNRTRFLFAKGAGHCDGKTADQTFPENLVWLWRGYPIP
jgi:iron(III)-enterobactin esterase